MTPDAWWSEVVKRAFLEGKPEALVAWEEIGALQAKLAQYESGKGTPKNKNFQVDLRALLNTYSQENGSNTPDFMLAEYVILCLAAFHEAVEQRDAWYGGDTKPTSPEGAVVRASAEDWTVDPKTHRSNSSPEFQRLVSEVAHLIQDEAHNLLSGRVESAAQLIMGQLAHKHGLAPRTVEEERASHGE